MLYIYIYIHTYVIYIYIYVYIVVIVICVYRHLTYNICLYIYIMSDGLFDYLDIAKQPQVFPSQLCTAIGDYAFNQCPRPSNCPPFSQKPCERLQLVPGIPSLWSPANSSSRSTKVAVHEVSWTLKQQPSNMMKFLRPHCSHTDTGSSYKSYEPLPVQAFLHELWGEANRLQVLAKAETSNLIV